MKRWIIFVHRYVGIPLSVIFVVWFLSGIVMMYTGGMPVLEGDARLRGRGPIDPGAIVLSPAEAVARAGLEGPIAGATLSNLLGRPAYRLRAGFRSTAVVFADDGEVFEDLAEERGRGEVARFLDQPVETVRFAGTLTSPDQWTITEIGKLPLDRYIVDDGKGTQVYLSRESGEVELVTRRATRLLAWLGAIPHWFYFTPLRIHQPLWYWLVVWVSAIGAGLAVLGIVLAFTQFRRSKPFRLQASIRYRGLMRWHYYTGALFGLFALTWVFSGMLSMEPFAWMNASGLDLPRNELSGGRLELDRYRLVDFASRIDRGQVYEIGLERVLGAPVFAVTRLPADGTSTRELVDAVTLAPRTEALPPPAILDELARTVEEARVVESTVLDDYDSYYYSQSRSAPLPVLRVKFNDAMDTWYYFDLMTGETVFASHRPGRLQRWLFNGLHSLDFSFWYRRRPFWDIGMILLSLGALGTSGIGMVLGFRRLTGRSAAAAPRRA